MRVGVQPLRREEALRQTTFQSATAIQGSCLVSLPDARVSTTTQFLSRKSPSLQRVLHVVRPVRERPKPRPVLALQVVLVSGGTKALGGPQNFVHLRHVPKSSCSLYRAFIETGARKVH